MSDAFIKVGVRPGSEIPDDDDSWLRSLVYERGEGYRRKEMYGLTAGRCARSSALYSANDNIVPFEADSASVGYMAVGDALEGVLAEGLRKAGRLLASNFRILKPKECPVSGKVDLVYLDRHGNVAMGEVKSCGELPERPNWYHAAQASIYAAMAGFDHCYLIYASRNVQFRWGEGLALRTFELPTDDAAMLARLTQAAEGQVAIRNKLLPPVPAHYRKTVECKFCEMAGYCHGGEDTSAFGLRAIEVGSKLEASWRAKAAALAEKLLAERPVRALHNLKALGKELPPEVPAAAFNALYERFRFLVDVQFGGTVPGPETVDYVDGKRLLRDDGEEGAKF